MSNVLRPNNPMKTPFMLTVDVEPDWGISGNDSVIQVLPRFCEMLRRLGIPATFFVVANMIDSCGEILRVELKDFEVASHGLTHRPLSTLSRNEVLKELIDSRTKLESFFLKPVVGFRAPYLKVPPQWFQLLKEAGYSYDSSVGRVFPSWHNRISSCWVIKRYDKIVEIPLTSLSTGLIPFSLTFLRILAPFGAHLVSQNAPIMFLHLHELADQKTSKVLPHYLRILLRRNSGEPAWTILEQTLKQFVVRAMTCGEVVSQFE